jgi:hypothetical protein
MVYLRGKKVAAGSMLAGNAFRFEATGILPRSNRIIKAGAPFLAVRMREKWGLLTS